MNLSRVVASLLFVGLTAFGCTTRTLILRHVHTGENLTVTYKRDGQYDNVALNKINLIMRDWRTNKATTMAPQLVDLLWEVYQRVGATQPIQIVGGYRTPSTNEMLRSSSPRSGVALHSLHMSGQAIDFYIPGVSLERLRETAMQLQAGGVGYYPKSGSPFVHLDVGSVSSWAQMPREQLLRLFLDGHTKHLPADNPLSGYAMARAYIEHGVDYRTVAKPTERSSQAPASSSNKSRDDATNPETDVVPRGVSPRPAPAAAAMVITAGSYQRYSRGCQTPYIPYGWTWHRAPGC